MTKKDPPGGRDRTPVPPSSGPAYIVRFIFHGANNLPAADFSGAADPFILAQLNTGLPVRHKVDPNLRFRSATARKSLNPKWEAEWVVAGVPGHGVELKTRLYDEDSGTYDDLLGRVHLKTGELKEGAKDKQTYKLIKRGADIRAWAFRSCIAALDRNVDLDATLTISYEVLGKSENIGKAYTINCFWWIHQSPVLGRIVGTKALTGPDGEKSEQADFLANEMQLRGPVPNELYHRYVEFKSFIRSMYQPTWLRGTTINFIMHRQHEEIYHFDAETEYGRLEGPGRAMTRRFLDMAQWGEAGRIFTYVIRTDGLMRFTETGPEFAIDLLSKHVMHADLDVYIACSGEFIVRKFKDGELEGAGEKVHKGRRDDTHIGDEAKENELVEHKGDDVPPGDGALPVERDTSGHPAERGRSGVRNDVQGVSQDAEGSQRDGDRPSNNSGDKRKDRRHRRKEAIAAACDRPIEQTHLHGPESPSRSTEPQDYELVIDNDSGTYRPDKELLPVLEEFLQKQFEGLHILALDCMDDRLKAIKKRQQKIKEKAAGGRRRLFRTGSDSSLSSSDEENLEAGKAVRGKKEKVYEAMEDPVSAAKRRIGGVFHKDKGNVESEKGGMNGKVQGMLRSTRKQDDR